MAEWDFGFADLGFADFGSVETGSLLQAFAATWVVAWFLDAQSKRMPPSAYREGLLREDSS